MPRLRPLAAALLVLLAPAPALAGPHADRLVAAAPATQAPAIMDGAAMAVARVGDAVVVGGTFTRARDPGSATDVARTRLLAFDARTGRLLPGFAPAIASGEVSAILPAADGASVYVAGSFTAIGGRTGKVHRLRLSDGASVPAFVPPAMGGRTWDLRLVGGRLLVAGSFTTVAGQPRGLLAGLDPTTGALLAGPNVTFAGVHNGGTPSIRKIEATPDGSTLVAIGNFRSAGGLERRQVAILSLAGTGAVTSWSTDRYAPACFTSFLTYMRDLDIDAAGRFFVIVTTGGPNGTTTLCDTAARFELGRTGGGQQPTWVNWSGGDTFTAVEIAEPAVYLGGHFRWLSNPGGRDSASTGAVPREGIGAVDPANGVPYNWNPGRARGYGVYDMIAPAEGLYVASDTDVLGGATRRKIGLLPLVDRRLLVRAVGAAGQGHVATARIVPGGFAEEAAWRLATAPATGLRELFECAVGARTFASTDPACEGATRVASLGFARTTATAGYEALLRCAPAGGGDSFVTASPTCEGTGLVVTATLGFAQPQPATSTWVPCASEGGACMPDGTRRVRYGAGGAFRTAVVTGRFACTNAFFGGDPAPGVVKACEYLRFAY